MKIHYPNPNKNTQEDQQIINSAADNNNDNIMEVTKKEAAGDSSSETSSYQSAEDLQNPKESVLNGKKYNINGVDLDLGSASSEGDDLQGAEAAMFDIDDEEGQGSTAYQKTTHEVDPMEVEKTGPELK